VTLIDAGPLVALVNRSEDAHVKCLVALGKATEPVITTWACLTEAAYLLGKYGGFQAQTALLKLLDDELVLLHLGSQEERQRIHQLMAQYRDAPMDFADASLVAAAESLNISTIFTLDRHFYAYLASGNKPFQVIP
jgi:Predicted nucleic acid-binding protein, contains PIN domain